MSIERLQMVRQFIVKAGGEADEECDCSKCKAIYAIDQAIEDEIKNKDRVKLAVQNLLLVLSGTQMPGLSKSASEIARASEDTVAHPTLESAMDEVMPVFQYTNEDANPVPTPQPVAWMGYSGVGEKIVSPKAIYSWMTIPLYTAPVPTPQRECETCARKRERLLKAVGSEISAPCQKRREEHMTKDEAMCLALDALENAPIEYDFHGDPMDAEFGKQQTAAITALHQALAAPEQEPVAWLDSDGFPWSEEGIKSRSFEDVYTPLYTAPVAAQPVDYLCDGARFKLSFDEKGKTHMLSGFKAELQGQWVALVDATDNRHMKAVAPVPAPQREWQGLTKAEINECVSAEIYSSTWAMSFARAIESKLKEKNT